MLAAGSEAVASLVGRADVMAAAFSFFAWWLFARRRTLAAAAAYFAACLCKESAIFFPLWLVAVELILNPTELRARRAGFLALAVAGAGYALARTLLYAPFSHVAVAADNNPLVGAPLGVRAWTAMRLLVLALRVLVAPLNLSPDYSGFQIRPDDALAWEPFVGAVALALLVGGAVALRRRDPPLAAGLALFVTTWLVISNIFLVLPTIFAERLLYLPAAGAALALARALERLAQRRRALALAVGALVAGSNLALAVVADRAWRDNLPLFAGAVEVSPLSARVWLNYGAALLHARRMAEAEAALRRSLALLPSAKAATDLGSLLDETGRPDEAYPWLSRALALDGDDAAANDNLARFYARHHHFDDAAALLRRYLLRHPDDAGLRTLLDHVENSRAAAGSRP